MPVTTLSSEACARLHGEAGRQEAILLRVVTLTGSATL